VAFLAAGFLRAAVFFRVVAFLAAGFLRAAVFFRVVAFLRVALLVRAAALLFLAGIAITFLTVGNNPIQYHRGAVRYPKMGGRIGLPLRVSRPRAGNALIEELLPDKSS
jgi:hypothetical protein